MPAQRTVAWVALVVALTAIAYAPVVRCGFIWDDDDYVTKNALLEDAAGLARIWRDPQALPQYYPLTFTTFWLEHQAWGLNPVGYHVVNVLLHAANAALLGVLLSRLAVRGAWVAATVFAVHPALIESVAWITERKNVLSLLFYLLAGMAYLRFSGVLSRRRADVPQGPQPSLVKGEARRRDVLHETSTTTVRPWGAYALALALFACALLSKSVTASLPAAILLVVWWKRGRLRVTDVVPLVPFFVLGAAMGLGTAWMEKHHVGAEGQTWSLTFLERCFLAGRVSWFYAAKLAWPHPLIFIYPRWRIETDGWWQVIFPSSALLLVVALWTARARLGRGPLVAVLFFIGTLFPALGFASVYPMRFSYVADHFQYHASLGLIALGAAAAAWGIARIGASWRRGVGAPAWCGVLAVLVALSWARIPTYRGVESLWRETLRQNPEAWIAHVNLGLILTDRGELTEAIDHFETAIRIDPHVPAAHGNLGAALDAAGRTEDALHHFEEAARMDADMATAQFGMGYTLDKLGRTSEAIAPYRAAVRLRPNWVSALENLAWIRATAPSENDRDGAEALALATRARDLTRGADAWALDTLAAALAESGRFEEAARTARAAIALAQRDGEAGHRGDIEQRLALYESGRPYRRGETRGAP